jgi:signal transduction histidine kinase/CheY-like chemotaxis protein
MENKSSILIQMLTKSMHQISQAKDGKEINRITEKLLLEFTDSDLATLFLFDPVKQALFVEQENNIPLNMLEAEGFLGEAFLTKKAAFYNHVISDKKYIAKIDNPDNMRLRSQIVVPIVEDDNLLGIVRTSRSIHSKKPYSRHELELLSSLEAFLIKIIHILVSNNKAHYKTTIEDTAKINEQIIEVSKNIDQPEVNSSTMMFLSNTVHDIRTPANSLFGFLELIEEQIEDKRLKGFISNAKESAQFINTLTDSILEETKQIHEMEKSKLTTINTIKFFKQITNTFSANMFDKKIHYITYLDPMLPKEIKIDELKLKRVLINLIGNAYKFTPKGKSVYFNVKFNKNDKKLDISVTDEGIGISDEKKKDIFNAFTQTQADTDNHFEGTGLGLSICAKYTNNIGGELKLESKVDEGSKFYFSIPSEIVDKTPSYEKFNNLNKIITILTNDLNSIDAKNIKNTLIDLGMPSEKIFIANKVEKKTTHLFCFQHKITPEILEDCTKNKTGVVLVEEELFSLSKAYQKFNIISENTYYGDLVHSAVFSGIKTKILIADDNKINIMLLESMLEGEYVEIISTLDGAKALELLKNAHQEKSPFDIIFLDKHMPVVTGSQVIEEFRTHEKKNRLSPIFAISITGDPNLNDKEKSIYDLLVNKPFNKQKVREAVKIYKKR